MAAVAVSICGSKHLSQSMLITRNLYTTLQIGPDSHKSPSVEVEEAIFNNCNPSDDLIVTLRNGQTQTVMYVRNVPLRLVAEEQRELTFWVAVHPPGDPRNLSFDDTAPPRADAPQVHLSLRCIGSALGGMGRRQPSVEALPRRTSVDSLQQSRDHVGMLVPASAPVISEERQSKLDRDALQIIEKERMAKALKSKVGGLAQAQRQAQTTEEQLQDAFRDIEEMRRKVEAAEEELRELNLRHSALEQERNSAREGCERARETLRLREQTIMELKNGRDEADRQLSQAILERDRQREQMEQSMKTFNDEVKSLADELERWRAESRDLNEALSRCDQRVGDLQNQQSSHSYDVGKTSEELRALQKQLNEAMAELEEVRQNSNTESVKLTRAEDDCQKARMRLAEAEQHAKAAREQLTLKTASAERDRRQSLDSRSEVDATERQLVATKKKEAQLEGQVGECANQLKDMEVRLKNVQDQVSTNISSHGDLEQTLSSLQKQVEIEELDGTQALNDGSMLKSKLSCVQEDVEHFRSKASELESSRREVELAHTRRLGELEATRRVVEAELGSVGGEIAKLRENQQFLQKSVDAVEMDAIRRGTELETTQAMAKAKEDELETTMAKRAKNEKERGEAVRRMAELQLELEEARRQLTAADSEAEQLRSSAEQAKLERKDKEKEAESRVEQLRSEMETIKVEQIRAAEQSVRQERERLKTAIQENRSNVQQQAALVKELQAKLAQQQVDLGVAASDASGGQTRKDVIKQALEDSRSGFENRAQLVNSEINEARSKQAETHAELGRLRDERAKLSSEQIDLTAMCKSAEDQLSKTNVDCQSMLAVNLKRLREMEAECAKHEAEETELNRRGAELEGRLGALEGKLSEDRGRHAKLESDLLVQRRKLGDAKSELEVCNNDIVATRAKQSAENANLSMLQLEAGTLERRSAELRDQLATFEAKAQRANVLRSELETAQKVQREALDQQGRTLGAQDAEFESTRKSIEDASAQMLVAKTAEIETRSKRIESLELEVQNMTNSLGSFSAERSQLVDRVTSAEVKQQEARAEVLEQEARLSVLRQELQILEDLKGNFEGKVISEQARLKVSEETSSLAEKDARERAQQLAELMAMAALATKDHEDRVMHVRAEVSAQEQQNSQSIAALEQHRNENRALREQRDLVRQRVLEMQSKYDILGGTLSQVQRDQQSVEIESRRAAEQAEQQLRALQEMEKGLAMFSGIGDGTEQQKIKLLREQLVSRQEQKKAAENEAYGFDAIKHDVNRELIQLQQERRVLGDKLVMQVEHSNLQFSTIEQLEEDIRNLDFEAALLDFGLRDAQQYLEYLQQENTLMKQKSDGVYQGTLQDWWAEIHRIRVLAEVERHKDELRNWQEAANEAEKELVVEVTKVRKRNEDVEKNWRGKLETLEEKLPHAFDRLKELDVEANMSEASGSVHSVPAALHGLVAPTRPLPPNASRRKALIIGCNYTKSRRPLHGCSNDVWNVQCLLRHSLQYSEDKVRCFIDGSDHCPSPPSRQPTKANIMAGIQWLVADAMPNDNLFLYFSGYGTQQPQVESNGALYESFLVPCDFADDLPTGFLNNPGQPLPRGAPTYRLVPLIELTNAMMRLPPSCKITLVFDCCHSVVPNVTSRNPAPAAFRRVRVQPLDHVPHSGSHPLSSQPRYLDLPPLPVPASRLAPGTPMCVCHCYASCQSEQWCAEFPIEGCVQGAFTWTFVKALTAGHLHTTVHQHGKALHSILAELRHHFRWIEQSPVIQLSSSAKLQDHVLL